MIHLFRTALITLAIMTAALANPLVLTDRAAAPAAFQAPASPRVTYNFNPGWRFIREDVPDAVKPPDKGMVDSWVGYLKGRGIRTVNQVAVTEAACQDMPFLCGGPAQ